MRPLFLVILFTHVIYDLSRHNATQMFTTFRSISLIALFIFEICQVKQSREKAKRLAIENKIETEMLEKENAELELKVAKLRRDLTKLKEDLVCYSTNKDFFFAV